jgi:hypothetical protein
MLSVYACQATKQLSKHEESFDLLNETNRPSLGQEMLFLSFVRRKISVANN